VRSSSTVMVQGWKVDGLSTERWTQLSSLSKRKRKIVKPAETWPVPDHGEQVSSKQATVVVSHVESARSPKGLLLTVLVSALAAISCSQERGSGSREPRADTNHGKPGTTQPASTRDFSGGRTTGQTTDPASVAVFDVQPTDTARAKAIAKIELDGVWEKGGPDGVGAEEFGILVDAALDAKLNAYILDRATSSVKVFHRDGRFLRSIGRSGHGPGELSDPLAMVHDRVHTLYLLDRVNGLLVVDTDPSDPRSSRSIRLPFIASDVCVFGNNLVAYGSHDGHPVHVLSASGELLRSLGEYVGPKEHPQHLPAYNDIGKVACFPDAGIVVSTNALFPYISAHRVADGKMLWSDSLPGFVPYGVVTTPKAYSIGQHRWGSDKQYVLQPVDENHVIVQSRRLKDQVEVIKTCVLNIHRPGCVTQTTGLPALMSISAGHSISIRENEYWYAALWRVTPVRDR
jgi:hypothetical protein